MKHFKEFTVGSEGFFGTVVEVFKPFKIIIEECMSYKVKSEKIGHVFFVYQHHEGKDIRTHMVKSLEDAKKCAEKIQDDILNQGAAIERGYENFQQYSKELEPLISFASNKSIFGKGVKHFGEFEPVYLEELSTGSFIVYELDERKEYITKSHQYGSYEEAETSAKVFAKENMISVLRTTVLHAIENYRKLGIILKEYPNDMYVVLGNLGEYLVYNFKGYTKYSSEYVETPFRFNSRIEAENCAERLSGKNSEES